MYLYIWSIFIGSERTELWYISRYFSIFWAETAQVPYPNQCHWHDRKHLQELFNIRQPRRRRFRKHHSIGHLDGVQLSASHTYLGSWECARVCLTTHFGRGSQSRLQPWAGKVSPERRWHPCWKASKVFWLQITSDHLVFSQSSFSQKMVGYSAFCSKQNLILLTDHRGVLDLYWCKTM